MVNVEWCHYCDEPECRKGVFDCASYKKKHPDYKSDPKYKEYLKEKAKGKKR